MTPKHSGIDEIRSRLEELVDIRLGCPLSKSEQAEWNALISAEAAFLGVQFS